ncbi:E3 ubiquitin-protein ligase TRIP12 [Rhizoctonia solani]|uniref:E3 ubiquitin-protein ligase TRIP12 n=1 Tax=Rhizoctonia solani TaxID=456999 RepID=A0A0K6G638_9AGAM|nr:E3 ubiquitin-protein ligase TRIP12 [Rhizoctonia solani]
MAQQSSQSSDQASPPSNIFSQGQLRDPGLEILMQGQSPTPASTVAHQTPSDSRDEAAFSQNVHQDSTNAGNAPPTPSQNSSDNAYDVSNNHEDSETSDSDTEMVDARSNFDIKSNVSRLQDQSIQPDPTSDDILNGIPNIFRLLDLVDEHGSVEKVVIDQHSLHRLLNIVRPGSYDSVSRINFKELDKLSIKPTGLYGNQSEIIKFLQQAQFLDDNAVALLSRVNKSTDSPPILRSGLYLALHPDHSYRGTSKFAYIIYWPEDTTWDDQAASSSVRRNRVTFMRYLTKLAEQTISLVSPSQARAFVWDTSAHNKDLPEDQQDNDDDSRLFSFEVSKSLEQEEDAVGSPGFTVSVESRLLPQDTEASRSRVRLIPGEQKTALLVVRHEREQPQEKRFEDTINHMNLRKMIESKDCPIQLGDDIKSEDLDILASHGLRSEYKGIFGKYGERLRGLESSRSAAETADKKHIEDRVNRDRPKVREEIQHSVRFQYDKLYPSLKIGFDVSHGPEVTAQLHLGFPNLSKVADDISRKQKLDVVQDKDFQSLKEKWLFIQGYFEKNPKIPRDEQTDFINDVLNGPGHRVDGKPAPKISSGFRSYLPSIPIPFFKGGNSSSYSSVASSGPGPNIGTVRRVSDPDFVAQLGPMEKDYPSLSDLTQRIYAGLGRNLEALEAKVIADQLDRVVSSERQRQNKAASDIREVEYREGKQQAFSTIMRELREAMQSNSRQIRIVNWIRPSGGYGYQYANAQFRWSGTIMSLRPAQNRHTIYPLELTEQESQLSRANEAHVPQPKVETRHKFEFALLKGRKVEFIQLIRDKCLVAASEPGKTRIYIEDKVTLDHAIQTTHGKVTLNHDSLGGSECKFALDQTTRLLAIVHGQKDDLKLSIYIFDELFANIRSRGSPIPLKNWYNQPVDISKICFVSGIEEVCVVETSGRVRVFSLITQQFRNASLQIDAPIVDAFSAPDGSCLLVAVAGQEKPSSHRLLAFHWASFGTNKKGIDSGGLPVCGGYRVVTRFEGRGRVHVISFDSVSRSITSTVLKITQKATEFSFRSDHEHSHKTAAETINNSLIDCHLEVWTRFPVVPAVARNTLAVVQREPRQLVFASPTILHEVTGYFARMISKFESTARKPMGGTLTSIEVKSVTRIDPNFVDQTSEFKLGSFIVELLCLIPLHLAVTRENRFIPLKDGVWDPDYERSLLGADVPAIIDALSLGWYESLLQSYMATKLVRVVSSMGEQSVGKSYCLNHFADTSFAGSAMRTTEGVWMSCTPTEEYLLVSLDFEGVHSIERSAQEDALLVLFNTAISNLVLFRNNFAMSRDIAGLFTSFQSSATVLDPNVNRGLFNSTLAIIIKDVTNADSKDIVKEFSLKFQGIVEKERDNNFITRLHRGRIQIIPWPVINSPGFYTLFGRLHQQLDKQPFTHGSAGAFLHNLKTLMAKIKTSDWGSLDQNLAAHRAQQLMERLPDALRYGRNEEGPLKNLDTDEELPISDQIPPFFVPEFSGSNVAENETLAEQALYSFVQSYGQAVSTRHQVPDASYVEALQNALYGVLDQRLARVQQWMAVNIERFPPGNQDIRNLTSKLDAAALAMRTAVQICSSGCSSCQLLCLRAHRHSGDHDCGTSHQCVFDCEVSEDHTQRAACGLPAGHGGRHMCDVKAHSCGMECHLSKMGGCVQSCIKPLDHQGEHLCSARAHLCGKPCDLRNVRKQSNGGVYSCPGRCDKPWDEPHERHTCNNSRACPIECTLCRRLCCSTDHFHGLDANAVHLCGQEHNCSRLCEADGICQIETRPSAIQDQFSGRHETFMYTRYTQVDRRLSCVTPIPPGELSHEGPHVHDTDEDAFHFCDARCPGCEYLCTLPLGHGQQQHETSHGSMSMTEWVLQTNDDDADPVYELQGRKFGMGDEGAPMLCNLVCAAQGRHAHIDYCRDPGNCSNTDCEHIMERMNPDPDREKDWISHATFWARSGFKDPYSQEEQNEFSQCDVLCAGPEHEATATSAANPSYCTLPIFHAPEPQAAYHIVFVIDSSGSMSDTDRLPLPNTPISPRLISSCNNRYGAVLSALYGFWLSRDAVALSGATQTRQDAYSVVTFNESATTRVQNDFTSSTDQLISQLLPQASGGTNFHAALTRAQSLIQTHWSSDRAPVIIFLSDGECNIADNPVYDLCRMCVQLGKALAFHSVSFGEDTYSASLRRMAEIAHEVFASAPQDVLTVGRGNPCGYANAIDSIQLADTFLGIANSLQKPRASLMNQYGSGGRRAIY